MDRRQLDRASDGTVPAWSTLPGIQSMPVGEEHMKLFRDSDLRRALATLLGAPGMLLAADGVRLAAGEHVAVPNRLLRVAILFAQSTPEVNGSLRWSRLTINEQGGVVEAQPDGEPIPITYNGPRSGRIGVELQTPSFAGHYQIEFIDGDGKASAPEGVVVQEPE